jgi:hypothetical protein
VDRISFKSSDINVLSNPLATVSMERGLPPRGRAPRVSSDGVIAPVDRSTDGTGFMASPFT